MAGTLTLGTSDRRKRFRDGEHEEWTDAEENAIVLPAHGDVIEISREALHLLLATAGFAPTDDEDTEDQ